MTPIFGPAGGRFLPVKVSGRPNYVAHLDELRQVFALALDATAGMFPAYQNDLYVVRLDVDGQYHTVTVGISNIRDHTVVVDSTKMEVVK